MEDVSFDKMAFLSDQPKVRASTLALLASLTCRQGTSLIP